MDPHSVQEVTSQSWFGRLGGSIKGVVIGLLFVIVAFPLLFWNEGRAVRRHRVLVEGAAVVVSVSADNVDPAHEGRLVHVSGPAATDEVVSDGDFGVSATALALRRHVEMYQWREQRRSEEREKLGGGTETLTTYEYERAWEDQLLDSSRFKQPQGHENPGAMPFSSRRFVAAQVRVGAFRLTPSQVERIGDERRLDIAADTVLPTHLGERARVAGGGIYLGDPTSATVGDVRVRFSIVPPGPVSLVAQQRGSELHPFRTESGGTIDLLATGSQSAAEMFVAAQSANTWLTWVLRAIGCLVMFLGLTMTFRPLSVVADVIPILGNLVEAGLGFVALLIALVLSLITIAGAWLFYRPLLGGSLLALAALLAFVVVRRTRSVRARGIRAPD